VGHSGFQQIFASCSIFCGLCGDFRVNMWQLAGRRPSSRHIAGFSTAIVQRADDRHDVRAPESRARWSREAVE
jgi:hypothetical protein